MKRFLTVLSLMFIQCFGIANAQAMDGNELTEKELEAFFDGSVGTLMSVHKIPGIAVAVVHNDRIVFTKGYGYADVARKRPVEPNETLFRVASISKTFTWTAVMQLVEKGKVELDSDVNEYLPQFKIPNTFEKPITLRHLMSHTAGFEDTMFARLFRRNADDVLELADALEQYLPARIREPGLSSSYSNYGTALAGLIVANVSGLPFGEYIKENILEPLGMRQSSFQEPLPEHLQKFASANFFRSNGGYIDKGWEYLGNFGPAASLTSTVVDMAQFMRAHLNEGSVDGQRILSKTTATNMRKRLFGHHPELNGVLHGFLESSYNGKKAYGHSGDSVHFHSEMAMFPQEELGIFIATNAPDGGAATKQVIPAFMDRYYPIVPTKQSDSTGIKTQSIPMDLQKYVGTYRLNRRSVTRWEKAATLGFGDATISISPQGGLVHSGRQRYMPVGGHVFQSVDNADNKIAFGEGVDGGIEHFFISVPTIAFQRISFMEAVSTHRIILLVGLMVSLFGAVQGLIKLPQLFGGSKVQVLGEVSIWLACIGNVLFFLILVILVVGDPVEVLFDGIPALGWLLVLPLLGALAILTAAVNFTYQLFSRSLSKLVILKRSVLLLVLSTFSWSMAYWNLLGSWDV